MGNRVDLDRVPHVRGWVSLPQAGDALKLSRQQIHRMAANGKFQTLSRIGNFLVVESDEVMEMVSGRLDNGEPSV